MGNCHTISFGGQRVRNSDWKAAAELIGISAIVASLIFVGFQLQLEQRAALSALSQSEISSRTTLDIAMSEFAEVWDKSNRGDPLSGSEQQIMKSLIDAWFRRAMTGYFDSRRLRRGEGNFSTADFAIMLYQNPGARRIWEEQTKSEYDLVQYLTPDSTFINEFAEKVQADLARLDERDH